MLADSLKSQPHRRRNPLTGEWVLVSPHRLSRPWQGKTESHSASERPQYDPQCYLCPGNSRANGAQNPDYAHTYVFDNDFAAIFPDQPDGFVNEDALFAAETVSGVARVICFSPDHSQTLAELPVTAIEKVVKLWGEQVEELSRHYPWVQIFENKGEIMGCSNPHPHGQLWATSALPSEAASEHQHQCHYQQSFGRAMLRDYAEREMATGERVVCANDDWVTVVPFWAVWPFETLVLPRFPCAHLNHLTAPAQHSLASHLKTLLSAYDQLFDTSFPYSMGWHGAPGGAAHPAWQLHAHFYPPLLRSANVKKFMVGFEMLGESQRDLTPETAADYIRRLI